MFTPLFGEMQGDYFNFHAAEQIVGKEPVSQNS